MPYLIEKCHECQLEMFMIQELLVVYEPGLIGRPIQTDVGIHGTQDWFVEIGLWEIVLWFSRVYYMWDLWGICPSVGRLLHRSLRCLLSTIVIRLRIGTGKQIENHQGFFMDFKLENSVTDRSE